MRRTQAHNGDITARFITRGEAGGGGARPGVTTPVACSVHMIRDVTVSALYVCGKCDGLASERNTLAWARFTSRFSVLDHDKSI